MKKITLFTLFLFFCWQSYCQINPIAATGYNEDVIANGVGTMQSSTSISIDDANFCFLSEDWKLNVGDGDITVGLPTSGEIESNVTTGLTYQIPTAGSPYEGNNSLRVSLSGASNSKTLTITTPESYSNLYFLVTSGSGVSTADAIVNFTDGSTQTFTGLSIPDWYGTGLPIELSGIGRGDRSNNNVETPSNNPKIFQLNLNIEPNNQTKLVESVEFIKNNIGGSVINVFAISGEEANDCVPPFDIQIENITLNTADVIWGSVDGITEWEIEYGSVGFTLGTGMVVQDNNAIGETLQNLNPATSYEVYVKSICISDSESNYVGPVVFDTPICDPSNQCNYKFILTDSYGDGWNGNSMNILQNDILVTTLQLGSGQEYEEILVPICDGVNFELYWNSGGSFGYEVGIEILDPSNNSIYFMEPNTGSANSSLYTSTGECPEPPANDDIINAIDLVLNASCTEDIYSNTLATTENFEPIASCFEPIDTMDNSVWFTFTAPENGAVNITTDIAPSDFDSQIAVYESPSDINDLSTLTGELTCNQNISEENTASNILLTGLVEGEVYYIQVDGHNQVQGTFCINVNTVACPDPTDITIFNVTGETAEVVWVSNGIETEWQVEYGPEGFVPGTGELIFDNDNDLGVFITDLEIDTDYDVYVSAICNNALSNSVGPISFTTPPCPNDIEVINDEALCGAIVTYNTPQSAPGGPSGNLLINGDANDELNGWTIDQNGGSGWTAINGEFVTSYTTCSKSQIINLSSVGFTDAQMDDSPEITISEDYRGVSSDPNDIYFLNVELRDEGGNVIESFSTGNITASVNTQTVTHTFTGYGAGVRNIYFQHGGDDAEGWTGNFGSAMNNGQVLVNLPTINVEQIDGLASGQEFPVGTTTNTFEITQGNSIPTTCTFNVTVLDVEIPNAISNDITIELDDNLTVNLVPDDIDAGSTDNCEILSRSLNITSLNCNDLGENEIIMTVTDVNGNSNTVSSIITLVDPNEYCELNVGRNSLLSLKVFPNPIGPEFFIDSNSKIIDKVEVYDVNGRKLKSFTVNSSNLFKGDISQLSSGIYFLKIYSENQNITKQVIKK